MARALVVAVALGVVAAVAATIATSASRTTMLQESTGEASGATSSPPADEQVEDRLAPGECWLYETVEPAHPDMQGAEDAFHATPDLAIHDLAGYARREVERTRAADESPSATVAAAYVERAIQQEQAVRELREWRREGPEGGHSVWTVEDPQGQVTAYARVDYWEGAGWQLSEHAAMLTDDICEGITPGADQG